MVALNTPKKIGPQFKLGQIVITTNADNVITEMAEKKLGEGMGAKIHASQTKEKLLKDHLQLKQGDLCDEDYQQNVEAIERTNEEGKPDPKGSLQSRIFSAYKIEDIKFWVITEIDESVSTILMPEDY